MTAAAHEDSADKNPSVVPLRWWTDHLVPIVLGSISSDKTKLKVKNQKMKDDEAETSSFFFNIIISVNHVPSSAPAQPQLPQAAPRKLKLKTDDVSLKSLCCYYFWLRIVNKPSGKSWMFQIFTTSYQLSHHLWLTTWCHLLPHQPAYRNLCLLILPACAALCSPGPRPAVKT